MLPQRADPYPFSRRSILALGTFGLLAGGAARSAEVPSGYRMDNYRASVPDRVPGGTVVHTDALKSLVDRGGVVLVDVLPAPRQPLDSKPGTPWMPMPRQDIPGSAWLPDVGRGAITAAMDSWFRARLAELAGGDLGRPVVFYCLKDCWMSWNAAKRAVTYGYTNIMWFPDGTEGWQAAGLPLARASALVPPE